MLNASRWRADGYGSSVTTLADYSNPGALPRTNALLRRKKRASWWRLHVRPATSRSYTKD
jgi:hypothetical protein